MKKHICAIFIFLLVPSLFGQKLSAFVPSFSSAELTSLRSGEIVIFENDSLNNFFSRLGSENLKTSAAINTASPGKMEALILIPGGSSLDAYDTRLHSVSTLEGLQYYSRSAKKIKTLIYSSYRVDDQDRKKKLSDLSASGTGSSWTMFQDDKSFGGNFYKASTRKESGSVHMAITNLTPMNVFFVTVFAPGQFQSYFSVIKTDEGYLVYCAFFYKTGFSFGMGNDIKESLTNRLKAFSSWISQ